MSKQCVASSPTDIGTTFFATISKIWFIVWCGICLGVHCHGCSRNFWLRTNGICLSHMWSGLCCACSWLLSVLCLYFCRSWWQLFIFHFILIFVCILLCCLPPRSLSHNCSRSHTMKSYPLTLLPFPNPVSVRCQVSVP